MKRLGRLLLPMIMVGILVLSGCATSGPNARSSQIRHTSTIDHNEAQLEATSNTPAFIGRIETAHGKGGFANPHLVIEVVADDGNKTTFCLMKNAIVTDVDGKGLNYMSNAQRGKKVEIKYSITDGQKRVLSMHYLN
jgi:hypothetical protein